jgi:hypothetical protein
MVTAMGSTPVRFAASRLAAPSAELPSGTVNVTGEAGDVGVALLPEPGSPLPQAAAAHASKTTAAMQTSRMEN